MVTAVMDLLACGWRVQGLLHIGFRIRGGQFSLGFSWDVGRIKAI